jgi:hypothetical protein
MVPLPNCEQLQQETASGLSTNSTDQGFHALIFSDAMLQTGRSLPRCQMRSMIFFFNLPNPSGRTRPWGLLSL